MKKSPIYVTKPDLPPLEEFLPYLEKIWDTRVLTNAGPFHFELEKKLCEYLGVKYISLFSNGTLALLTALQALDIRGEVITTPYSFVATTHALWWNGIKPVFVDIEPETFTIDPAKIEAAITPKTTAILPVHVYGNPCKVQKIEEIARDNSLKVIYDACHTFGNKINNIPILNYGDLSVISFHATKVFNTFEGGAIVCHDVNTKKHIDELKNFGIINETTVISPGINAKMNEFQAALGILQLNYVNDAIRKRKNIDEAYKKSLKRVPGISIFTDQPGITHNYAYFPVTIDAEIFGSNRDDIYNELISNNVFPRKYFYPLISQFPMYKNLESAKPGNLKVAERVTKEILCLPIYADLEIADVNFICGIIKKLKK